MTKSVVLLRRFLLFALGFTVLCVAFAMRFSYDSTGDFVALTIGAALMLAPFAAAIFFLVALWTMVTHGLPTIQREASGPAFRAEEDSNLRVSMTGEPMRNGVDLSGNPYGIDRHD